MLFMNEYSAIMNNDDDDNDNAKDFCIQLLKVREGNYKIKRTIHYHCFSF